MSAWRPTQGQPIPTMPPPGHPAPAPTITPAIASTAGRRRSLIAALAMLAILVAADFIYRYGHPVVVAPGLSPFAGVREQGEQVPVLFNSPWFSFVDQDGRKVLSSDLGGRIWIADFIFTNCAGQ